MPRGKYKRQNKLKNEQTVLTTRLIQISLKTDDHIYNGKRIAASAAKDYIQELSSLKLKCPHKDVRSLQVIEKLTRLMKTIITEDQDMHVDHSLNTQADTDFTDVTDFTRTSSPVYSLPDEDRTDILTENTFVVYVPIIDITEDSNGIYDIQEQNNTFENVNNALSNMAIQDEFGIAQTIVIDNDCSQSILENYHDDNTVFNEIHREKDIDIVHASSNNLEGQHQFLNDITNQQASQRNNVDIVGNVNKTIVVAEIHNPYTMSNTLSQPIPPAIKPPNNVPKKGKGRAKINIIDESLLGEGKKKKIVRKKKDKGTEEKPKKRKTKAKVNNNDEANDILSKQNNQQEKESINVADSHSYSTEINITKPVLKIYNDNVENDLSWVENLRYVREVSPQENDPTLNILDDNFWDNYSLPNNWNDQDFDF